MIPLERGRAHRRIYSATPAEDFARMSPEDGIAWMASEDDADGAPEQTYSREDGAAFVRGALEGAR